MSDIDLLVLDRNVTEAPSADTRFGGLPSADSDVAWPACRECGGNMQFLGQVRLAGARRLHLIFMCANDPGMCSDWEADGGCNAVIGTGIDGLGIVEAPSEGEVVRGKPYGARIEQVQAADYGQARTLWEERHPGREQEVLGFIGGEADWLQGDETPSCDHCGEPMRFVVQLEEGPDDGSGMNFGGGCGYLFECDCAGGSGKFLWQS